MALELGKKANDREEPGWVSGWGGKRASAISQSQQVGLLSLYLLQDTLSVISSILTREYN